MEGYRFALLTTLLVFGLSNAVFAGFFEDTLTKAQQGVAKAQLDLGLTYDDGRGVPENDAEAVTWYRKAAEQGYAQAQLNLGIMYYFGEGVPENDVKAYAWLSLAKAQGLESAVKATEIVKNQMTTQQIAEGQAVAATRGEHEVHKALRKSLLKYRLHTDWILFDRAYAYIKEYFKAVTERFCIQKYSSRHQT